MRGGWDGGGGAFPVRFTEARRFFLYFLFFQSYRFHPYLSHTSFIHTCLDRLSWVNRRVRCEIDVKFRVREYFPIVCERFI